MSDPFAAGIIQVAPLDPALAPLTDVYFRGYDQNYPDLWRYNEWKREFDQFVAYGNLPNLSLGGVNTPETQQADDYAVGKLVEAVASSRYASSTLIIITEDDCQDGPDHVDSHRVTAYVVGPYVKQRALVSTRFGQVNALRTIKDAAYWTKVTARFYPIAAGLALQVAFPGGQFPKYGGLGAFGIQGPGLTLHDLSIGEVSHKYGFERQHIYNLECTNVIKDGSGLAGAHCDIAKPEVAHALWEAVKAS